MDFGHKSARLLTQASHLRWPVFPSQRPVPLRQPKKYAEDGGPLTDNVVFTAFSGFSFLSVKRFFGARSLARPQTGALNKSISGQAHQGRLYGMTL